MLVPGKPEPETVMGVPTGAAEGVTEKDSVVRVKRACAVSWETSPVAITA